MKKTALIAFLVVTLSVAAFAELPDVFGEPLHEVELEEGFVPDPYEHDMAAGGGTMFDAEADLGDDYFAREGDVVSPAGYIYGSGPDVRFFYDASQGASIYFAFEAEDGGDTFIVVNDPDGDWWVVDDSDFGLDPAFGIEGAPAGQYDIWVGTWQEDTVFGSFYISELGPFGEF